MDILIKNIEMPSSCVGCKLVQRYRYSDECQYLHKKIAHNGRLKDCPLVELPPHGRLINADAIRKSLSTDCPCRGCERFHEEGACMNCQWDRFVRLIDDAPTVLEASTC